MTPWEIVFLGCKGPFTPRESQSKSDKDQRTSERDQRKNFKHQRKFSFSFLFSAGVNEP